MEVCVGGLGVEIGLQQCCHITLSFCESLVQSDVGLFLSRHTFSLLLLDLVEDGPEVLGLLGGESNLIRDERHLFGLEFLKVRLAVTFVIVVLRLRECCSCDTDCQQ